MEAIQPAVDDEPAPPTEAVAPQERPDDPTPDQAFMAHLLRVIDGLAGEAAERKKPGILIDVLTWELAQITRWAGPYGMSHILERLGSYARITLIKRTRTNASGPRYSPRHH
jgi:hypothetical protein